MKVLAVLLLCGWVSGRQSLSGQDWHMFKTWTTMKAQESCLGEENMKIHTINIKTAIAKCHQEDAPELSLPPFRSHYRFVNTLMTSADEMEQNQIFFFYKLMQHIQEQHSHDHDDDHHFVKPYSMDYESKPWMEKIMQKMAMKNMFEKNMKNGYNSMKFEDMDFDMYTSKKNMFDHDSSHRYEYNPYESKVFEDKMMENMMKYKLEQMEKAQNENSYRTYNPFSNKDSYRERMAALLQRNKRQAPANTPVTLPESLDLGDRLADKLKEENNKFEAEVGNMTCVLREMGVLNQQNELDFNTQKRAFEKFNMPNKWLKNRFLDGMEVCIKMADSLPSEISDRQNFPGLVNLSKVQTYMRCYKYSKMRTCMAKDIKEKLETNFGPVEKILEQTQMTEDQLFPLVFQLLNGEEMEYFGY